MNCALESVGKVEVVLRHILIGQENRPPDRRTQLSHVAGPGIPEHGIKGRLGESLDRFVQLLVGQNPKPLRQIDDIVGPFPQGWNP